MVKNQPSNAADLGQIPHTWEQLSPSTAAINRSQLLTTKSPAAATKTRHINISQLNIIFKKRLLSTCVNEYLQSNSMACHRDIGCLQLSKFAKSTCAFLHLTHLKMGYRHCLLLPRLFYPLVLTNEKGKLIQHGTLRASGRTSSLLLRYTRES